MSKPRTILVWGQNDLLARSMESFLMAGEAETWQVIRLSGDPCVSTLVEQMRQSKPDLVILYRSSPGEAYGPLSKLIQEQPDLKIITVSLENNVMQLYSKRSITVHQASDLLSVIEDRYFPENQS